MISFINDPKELNGSRALVIGGSGGTGAISFLTDMDVVVRYVRCQLAPNDLPESWHFQDSVTLISCSSPSFGEIQIGHPVASCGVGMGRKAVHHSRDCDFGQQA